MFCGHCRKGPFDASTGNRNERNAFVVTFSLLLVLSFVVTKNGVHAQIESPCPGVFRYLATEGPADGRWTGEIDLSTDDELHGVWIHLVLDKRANLLLNWFGESSTTDNMQYAIRRPEYKLLPGPKVVVKVQVSYNAAEVAPQIKSIRLNGRSICSADTKKKVRTTEPPKPFVSHHITEPYEDDGLTLQPTFGSFGRLPEDKLNGNLLGFSAGRRTESTTVPFGTTFAKVSSPRPLVPNKWYDESEQVTAKTTLPPPRPLNPNKWYDESERAVTAKTSLVPRPLDPNKWYDDGLSLPLATTASSGRRPASQQQQQPQPQQEEQTRRPSSRPSRPKPVASQPSSEEFFAGDFNFRPSKPKNPPRVLGKEEKCGVSVPKAVGLITHGRNALHGAWPWHVAIFAPDGLGTKYICGASLITKRHAITAAHCVTRPNTNTPSDAEGLLLHIGRTNLKRFGRESQDRHVDRIIVHPEYNNVNYHHDVAILVMNQPTQYTDYVRPICRWHQSYDNSIVNKLGTVVGWGFNEEFEITDHLQETKMPVVETVTCIYSNPDVFSRVTNGNYTFCAGFLNGTSVCNGDSGSGMFFKRPDPDNGETERWELRGIVSVGQPRQNRPHLCDPFGYTVFVDLYSYSQWITNNIYDE